jgi:hypothetical protein
MSVSKKMLEEKRGLGSKKSSQVSSKPLITFHPTKDQKLELQAIANLTPEAWEAMELKLDQGCRLTLGVNQDNGSYFCILREPGSDWSTARAVSIWNTTLERVLIGLYYFLANVSPDFPDDLPRQTFTNDW